MYEIFILGQERTYSLHYSPDVDEEGDEALTSMENETNDDFKDIEEFWFDDILCGGDDLPDHLLLQPSTEFEEELEQYTPQTHYILDCENGKKLYNVTKQISCLIFYFQIQSSPCH